jgi:hypothetical protein
MKHTWMERQIYVILLIMNYFTMFYGIVNVGRNLLNTRCTALMKVFCFRIILFLAKAN